MDELEIGGKKFISSRRAAKEHKYHSDYIGQLIRMGKIIGTKVGRAWYVEAESLAQYLGQEEAQRTSSPQDAPRVDPPMVASRLEIKPEPAVPSEPIRKSGLTYVPASENDVVFSPSQPRAREDNARAVLAEPEKVATEVTRHSRSHEPFPAPRALPSRALQRIGAAAVVSCAVFAFIGVLGSSYLLSYTINYADGVAAVRMGIDR